MRPKRISTITTLVALLICLSGYAAYAKDEVHIVSFTPSTRSSLHAGDSVTFEVTLDFSASVASSRMLRLSIFRGGNGERSEELSEWAQAIPEGRDKATIQRTVIIPATNRISLEAVIEDLRLGPQGLRKQWAEDRREFGVVDQAGKRIKPGGDGDSLKIVSLSPGTGTLLHGGETRQFEFKIDYDLRSSDSGRVSWGILSGRGNEAGGFTQTVQKGKGSLSLSGEVQFLPEMGPSPTLYVVLYADGYARRVATDVAQYTMQSSPVALDSSQLQVDVSGRSQDRVRIERVLPLVGTEFREGTYIDLELRIEYELASLDDAELDIRYKNRNPIGEDYRIVHRGKGSITFARRILVSKDFGPEISITTILGVPPVGRDTLLFKVAPQ